MRHKEQEEVQAAGDRPWAESGSGGSSAMGRSAGGMSVADECSGASVCFVHPRGLSALTIIPLVTIN